MTNRHNGYNGSRVRYAVTFVANKPNWHSRSMLRVISCIVLFGLVACSSKSPAPVAPADLPNKPGGDWFCEMHPNGEEWSCVRDENLSRHPKPSRLPEPKPIPVPVDARTPPPPARSSLAAAANPQPAPLPEPVEAEVASVSGEQVPAHVRLAYKPEKPVSIIELSPDLYAIQLIAMSTPDALETFVEDNRLLGMSAARVANEDRVFYVLLLGIYESAEIAREAVAGIGPPLDKQTPWIRRLGSLQEAMIRANGIIAGNSE